MEKFIIKEGGQGEIVEKKSRFIATVLPIDTEEEALQYIEKIKKKYANALNSWQSLFRLSKVTMM